MKRIQLVLDKCVGTRGQENNRPTHMLPSLNAAAPRRHDRTITCRGGRKITRCSCPDCVPSKESPPAAPAGPPPADSGRLLSIVKKRITLSDFGLHSALLLAVYVFFLLFSFQRATTTPDRRRPDRNQKEDDDDGRKKRREQKDGQNCERQTLVYPREGQRNRYHRPETPRVERQPPAGGTDESGNNMPTHY